MSIIRKFSPIFYRRHNFTFIRRCDQESEIVEGITIRIDDWHTHIVMYCSPTSLHIRFSLIFPAHSFGWLIVFERRVIVSSFHVLPLHSDRWGIVKNERSTPILSSVHKSWNQSRLYKPIWISHAFAPKEENCSRKKELIYLPTIFLQPITKKIGLIWEI